MSRTSTQHRAAAPTALMRTAPTLGAQVVQIFVQQQPALPLDQNSFKQRAVLSSTRCVEMMIVRGRAMKSLSSSPRKACLVGASIPRRATSNMVTGA